MGTSAVEGAGGNGSGNAPDNAGGGQGSAGTGGGTGNGGAGAGAPNAGGTGTLDRNKLNPLLRGMPEEQLNEVFDALMTAARRPAGQDMSGVPAHARPAPAAPKVPTRDELKDMLDPNSEKFDPESAFKSVVEANYGGLLTDISRNASAGVKAEVRRQLPDFDQYEADIDTVLSGVPNVNAAVIVDTYFRVKGLRTTQKEIEERARPPKTVAPSPAKSSIESEISAEDQEIARVMFRGSADPIAEYRKAQQMMETQHIRVPGDPKK